MNIGQRRTYWDVNKSTDRGSAGMCVTHVMWLCSPPLFVMLLSVNYSWEIQNMWSLCAWCTGMDSRVCVHRSLVSGCLYCIFMLWKIYTLLWELLYGIVCIKLENIKGIIYNELCCLYGRNLIYVKPLFKWDRYNVNGNRVMRVEPMKV